MAVWGQDRLLLPLSPPFWTAQMQPFALRFLSFCLLQGLAPLLPWGNETKQAKIALGLGGWVSPLSMVPGGPMSLRSNHW